MVAIITIMVVGPRDLPKVMRAVGQWVRRARELAREFQSGLDQMAREAELEELRDTAREVKNFTPKGMAKRMLDPQGEIDDLSHRIAEPADVGREPLAKPSEDKT